jgi:hypothetical protein
VYFNLKQKTTIISEITVTGYIEWSMMNATSGAGRTAWHSGEPTSTSVFVFVGSCCPIFTCLCLKRILLIFKVKGHGSNF